MVWLPDDEKKSAHISTRFDKMYERDGHTHTPHDGIGRVCIASPGKNHDFRPISRFISQMMQDRAIVTAPKLSKCTGLNDLE